MLPYSVESFFHWPILYWMELTHLPPINLAWNSKQIDVFTIIEWKLQSLCICWRTFRKWSSSGRRETEWICLPCAITSFGILCSYFSITSIGDIGSKDFCGRRWWCYIWGTKENDCSVREQSTLILHVNYWGRVKESYLANLICKKHERIQRYDLIWVDKDEWMISIRILFPRSSPWSILYVCCSRLFGTFLYCGFISYNVYSLIIVIESLSLLFPRFLKQCDHLSVINCK